jgi:hypothetical protein
VNRLRMTVVVAAAALFGGVAAIARAQAPGTTPVPIPAPTPTAVTYQGNPAARFTVVSRPLGFDADGNAVWLVVSKFFDAQGRVTKVMTNSDLDWTSKDGYVQWQTRPMFGQPSAILRSNRNGPLTMVVRSNKPNLGTVTVRTDTRTWRGPRVVASALGPHTIQVGWFPLVRSTVRVVRIDGEGRRKTVAVIAGPNSNFRDTTVLPGHHYRYVVYRAGYAPARLGPVAALPPPPPTSVENAAGTAMYLWFTVSPTDAIYYGHFDPARIARQAVQAHLHYVELRVAYGDFWEITPQAKPTIDAIIDGLAAHGIGTIGWTVPRDTTIEDLRQSMRAIYYTTAKGNHFTGLAIDLERGSDFLGDAPQGLQALWMYARDIRQAAGKRYMLLATVEDPYMEHLNDAKYPYPQIAQYSSVLQPMAYWRMLRRHPTSPAQVKVLLKGSFDRLRYLSKSNVPISIGGQTSAASPNGAASAPEITASLEVSKAIGAIGECFWAWDGNTAWDTAPFQWDAIADFRWFR